MKPSRNLYPPNPDLTGRDDSERVSIQIWYNGGFPRTHSGVSIGFLRRLNAFLRKHPKCDVEWRFT